MTGMLHLTIERTRLDELVNMVQKGRAIKVMLYILCGIKGNKMTTIRGDVSFSNQDYTVISSKDAYLI